MDQGSTTLLTYPFHTASPVEPPAEFARLRREQPVAPVELPGGHRAWLITRHADVRRALSDRVFSREATTRPGAPRLFPLAQGSKSIFVMDPPEHTRLRRLVSHVFVARHTEMLRDRVGRAAASLLSDVRRDGPGVDLVSRFAKPLPIAVICELLGVPEADVATFSGWTDVMLEYGAGAKDRVLQARDSLTGYLRTLIDNKRAKPGDDLLTGLVQARDDDDALTEDELIAFGYTLLGAGYHATAAEIVYGLLALLRRPAQLAELRDDPAVAASGVDELIRFSQTGGIGSIRIALEDVQIGGVRVAAGEAVLPSINAANRDPEVFTEPDELDLRRSPNPHLGFGHGIHHCLGAQLGRMELEIALTGLLRALPRLALAVPEEELHWPSAGAFRLPQTLPVTWIRGGMS